MTKLLKILWILKSLTEAENRQKLKTLFREYWHDATTQKLKRSYPEPYHAENLDLGLNHKILLVVHQFSRTGAPYAALYLARAIYTIMGVHPVVIAPVDGPLRAEFASEGFPTIVDPMLFSYHDYSPKACEFVSHFDRVIVTPLAAYNFIRRFRGIAKRLTWWIHETGVGFNAVASMAADLPLLFSVCESVWLGSSLCFPHALRYTKADALELVLYGSEDTAISHRPHPSGKRVFALIGSVEPRKGQDIFVAAIQRLPEALREQAIFRIIGSPLPFDDSVVFHKKICALARQIPQLECIDTMPIAELRDYYAETDVLVSASRDDPMPIVVTEGLMFSMVCLCSSAIGQAPLLEDGKNGLIFTSESAEDLANKLTWLLLNPEQLPPLGAGGRKVYEQYFQMSSFIDHIRQLLR